MHTSDANLKGIYGKGRSKNKDEKTSLHHTVKKKKKRKITLLAAAVASNP